MNAQSRFNLPIRATYGEKDNMHTLLSCSRDGLALPAALAGFTDKPQGHLAPGEIWWPSVGCGPFGEWWAIWWSMPDDRAARAGMARAEVALWSIDDVSEIEDLGRVIESLNGGAPVPAASPGILAAVAEALIRDSSVPVIADLNQWPSVLAGLWPRLWPETRREFSAWVTLSPPQVGDSKYIPSVYVIPSDREKQWSSQVLVSPLDSSAVSRGARWLIGNSDTTINELLAECPFPDGSVTHLSRIARAAERLDRVRSSPDATSGTELARTLAAIAPQVAGASKHKNEALLAVSTHLSSAPLSAIHALANLDASHFPTEAMPSNALEEWIVHELSDLPHSNLQTILTIFVSRKAQSWWLDAFRRALRKGLSESELTWYSLAFFWLCAIPDLSELLANTVNPVQLETGVIDVFKNSQVTEEQLQSLRQATHFLKWSRLHALAVWGLLAPTEAFQKQLCFTENPWEGVNLLLDKARDEDVVSSAVKLKDARLINAAVRLSIVKPDLLRLMDLDVSGWRQLWVKHIAGGGLPWPSSIRRDVQAPKFLQAVFSDHYELGPVAQLAPDFALAALELPEREKIWARLQPNEADSLLHETAKLLLMKLEQGEVYSQPERELSDAILKQAEHIKLSPQALIAIVFWYPGLEEFTVQRWVSQISLAGEAGQQIGKYIRDRRWNSIAKTLYIRFSSGEHGVLAALSECRDLLWWWEKIYVPMLGSAGVTAPTKEDLVRRAGELGGDLAAFSLDDIWERAGGSVKMLRAHGTPAERWNHACKKADDGALGGGLLSLVDVLLADLPNNHQLVELQRVLIQRSR